MSSRYCLLVLLVLALVTNTCDTDDPSQVIPADHQSVLLISLDGFAFDYRGKASTPTLDSLVLNGVQAESLTPVFPSKTFPNHYTQVTGLYPDNHGIIANRMYDAEFGEYFSLSEPSVKDGKWYGGEPIWSTCQKQGLTSATMFWPGSDAEIGGVRPDQFIVFNGALANETRVEQVLEWMRQGDARPHFISLYFEVIDQIGHQFGPDHQSIIQSIETVDHLLGELCSSLIQMELQHRVNIIIVSDHGMTALSPERVIFLDDYLDISQVEVINWSPLLELIPLPGQEETIYQSLVDKHPNWQVFRKEDLPEAWRFKDNPRITPLVAIADLGWSITTRSFFGANAGNFEGGNHGYDPQEISMGGVFMASGPGFNRGVTIESVESVHLYELMCALLDIEPAANDGDLSVWEEVLL